MNTTSTETEARTAVVVGLDGSEDSDRALDWAIATYGDEAVTPVAVFRVPLTAGAFSPAAPPLDPALFREATEARLDAQLADRPGLRDRTEILEGHAGVSLTRRAAQGDLLVVGTRGRGGIASAMLGSTSSYCAKHASVPTVIVPSGADGVQRPRTIVVGVDGSSNSDSALAWARSTVAPDGKLVAVAALSNWNLLTTEYAPPPAMIDQELNQILKGALARMATLEADPETSVDIESVIVQQDARSALPKVVEQTDADMLVVGARGTGGLGYLLLGSVATTIVHHPTVVTAVIPQQQP